MYQQISQYFDQRGDIEALVLTSFGLDVGYFEKFILPAFFPSLGEGPASEPHRPLFEFLEENQIPISVLFDANQLQTGEQLVNASANIVKELRWQVHPVMPRTGFFHSKIILALVNKDGQKSLVLGTTSANLTRSGWAHNFEACTLVELKLQEGKSSLLVDVASLVDSLEPNAENSKSLQMISQHIDAFHAEAASLSESSDRYRTRLWFGQGGLSLTNWLKQHVLHNDMKGGKWHLEVLSPYYSDELPSLITWASKELTAGAEAPTRKDVIRCFCPKIDGQYDIEHDTLERYSNSGVIWSSLTGESLKSKKKDTEGNALERYLHAKVFRFWSTQSEVIVVGSANATKQGMRDDGQGNQEASLVISSTVQDGSELKSWLQPIKAEITEAQCKKVSLTEDSANDDEKVPDLSTTFDWETKKISLHNNESEPLEIYLGNNATPIWSLEAVTSIEEILEGQLIGSLFNSPTIKVKKSSSINKAWICLVNESGLHAKPPAPTMERTIDELIRDWQLGPVDRFIERVGIAGLPDDSHHMTDYSADTIQSEPIEDKLNDMFLAISKFRKEIEAKLDISDEPSEFTLMQIKTRLFGQGAMSVSYFAKKLYQSINNDNGVSGLSCTEAYIAILTLMDALQQLTVLGFKEEFSTLILGLHKKYLNQLRKRVLKELKQDRESPEPSELITWVEQHFSYHRNQFNGQY